MGIWGFTWEFRELLGIYGIYENFGIHLRVVGYLGFIEFTVIMGFTLDSWDLLRIHRN